MMRRSGGEDRISRLSDDVLCHILWFLGSEEVIKTSLLSKRWRYLWRMVPALDFDYCERRGYEKVNKFLSLRTTQRIIRFSLNVAASKSYGQSWLPSFSYVDDWLLAAITYGKVEHLNLSICYSSIFLCSLPKVITCTTIVTLNLKVTHLSFHPSSIRLPSLKTLHLHVDSVSSITHFNNIFNESPLLQLFHLKQMEASDFSVRELKIALGPRHIRLFERRSGYDGCVCKFQLFIESDRQYDFIPHYLNGRLEYLVNANVYITVFGTSFCLNSNVFFTLKKLCNVEFLSFADFRVENDRIFYDLPKFRNLVQLRLYLKDAHDSLLLKLPAECPKLQDFESVIMDDGYDISKRCLYHDLSIVPI